MKKLVLTIFTITLAFSSCDFDEEINVSPAIPADVSAQAIVPAAQAGLAFAIGGEMVRISGLFMQHFVGINAQQKDNYEYLVKSSDMDGVWRRMYYDSLNPLNVILGKAEAEGSNHTAGMAKVLIAHGVGSLADMFGDVPFSEAWQSAEGNFFPVYDTQDQIYASIQSLLDEAIADLSGDAGSGPSLGSDDYMYSGDTDQWIRIAYSLKAKYYIHLSKVSSTAYSDALGVMANAMTSNAHDFQFLFGNNTNEANPQYQFSQDRGGNINFNTTFFDRLNTLNDPRRSALFNLDTGDDPDPSGFSSDFNSGTFYSTINSPVVFMSYSELKFIEAEAELMGNGDVGAAQTALEEAIGQSIINLTGNADAAYVAANSDLASLGTTAEQLELIMEQKWIALYSVGLESWTDFRRTGYPAITPVAGGNNAFNLNGEVPRRLPYPQNEVDLNASNVPTNAPDFQDRFWWDDV